MKINQPTNSPDAPACERPVRKPKIICGVEGGVAWTYTKDRILTLSPAGDRTNVRFGNGQMKDFSRPSRPWRNHWYTHWRIFPYGPVRPVIEEGVTEIGDYAFHGCSALCGPLVFPDSVKRIGRHAFSDCQGLTEPLVISDSVTQLADNAFSNSPGIWSPRADKDSRFCEISGIIYNAEKTVLVFCPPETTGTLADLDIPPTVKKSGRMHF
ncbi:MAG TPA: leucine-rich repeat domain-containing protein [Methanocorpusculum sp.]|nr:leucine-rich repeat domain-containing protein [Methanocorpusculum sp.]